MTISHRRARRRLHRREGQLPPAEGPGRGATRQLPRTDQSSPADCRLQGRCEVVVRDGGLAASKLAVMLSVKTAAGRASRRRAGPPGRALPVVRCAPVAYPPGTAEDPAVHRHYYPPYHQRGRSGS